MSYWINNSMGFPISIASLKLTENRNVKKISEIARESKNSDRDNDLPLTL